MAEDSAVASRPVVVIVAVADRETRRRWTHALVEAGCLVRVATRPAEVAKAQADGAARLIVRRDHQDDALLTITVTLPVLAFAPSVPAHDLPGQIHTALANPASASAPQDTSSA